MSDDDQQNADANFPDPIALPPNGTKQDLKPDQAYKARVNNKADYGVFVSLEGGKDEISGLVHSSNLPPMTSLADFNIDDTMIVALDKRKPNGDLAFNGLKAPDAAPDAPRESIEGTTHQTSELVEELEETRTTIESVFGDFEESPSAFNSPVADAITKIKALSSQGCPVDAYNFSREQETVTVSISFDTSGSEMTNSPE